MISLGICGGHDANWCVFKDGKLLGAFEKERFSRIRHDSGNVMDYVEKTLRKLGISPNEIDVIMTTEANFKGTYPGLEYVSKKVYDEPNEWVEMKVKFYGREIPCFSVPHHLSHASYAFYTSNEEESVTLTWDGGGDFYTTNAYTSTSISYWENNKLKWFKKIGNCDIGSLWHIYSKSIFQNPFAAGKLMGLAALGENKFVETFADYCMRPVRGCLNPAKAIKNCWPDEDMPMFSAVNSWQHKDAADIAYAIQKVTNYAGINLAKKAYEVTKAKTLCLGGGVALNGYLNTELAKLKIFDRVFVPPSVHDGGLSLGAVMFILNNVLNLKTCKISDQDLVFNGTEYNDEECIGAIQKYGVKAEPLNRFSIIQRTAEEISNGKVIAWYEGKSEHGPRALGHRSLLADPRYPKIKERLNNEIKFREPFRPIAPVVLEKDVHYCTRDIEYSPFMMHIVETTDEFRDENPAAVHLDGTARIQTVAGNSGIGEIIEYMKENTGGKALLNTSFNCNEPIVETPENAIKTFLEVPIDYLCLNGKFWIKKE